MAKKKKNVQRKNVPKPSLCPKCLEMKLLTTHHIYPRRHFQNSPTIRICRLCHDALELNIPMHKIELELYVEILVNFLRRK